MTSTRERQAQRLTTLSPPGALLKRAIAVEPAARSFRQGDSDAAYLIQVRLLPCLKCGMEPCGEAAHVRAQSGAHGKRSAMQKRPEDRWALPLCGSCHREDRDAQHKVGELAFWHWLGINPLLVCTRLYAAKDDPVRMRAVVFVAIAERESASQFRVGR
jgi:hypothetical protein